VEPLEVWTCQRAENLKKKKEGECFIDLGDGHPWEEALRTRGFVFWACLQEFVFGDPFSGA